MANYLKYLFPLAQHKSENRVTGRMQQFSCYQLRTATSFACHTLRRQFLGRAADASLIVIAAPFCEGKRIHSYVVSQSAHSLQDTHNGIRDHLLTVSVPPQGDPVVVLRRLVGVARYRWTLEHFFENSAFFLFSCQIGSCPGADIAEF